MGHVQVHGADVEDGRIQQLRVKIPNLPPRTIDRDTAVAWMRDGHSMLPVRDDHEQAALLLIEVPEDDTVARFIRDDTEKKAEDAVPDLPPVAKAKV